MHLARATAVFCGFAATRLQHLDFAFGRMEPRRFSATRLPELDTRHRVSSFWPFPHYLGKGRGLGFRGETGSMDAKTSLKSRLPSRHVTEGPERAPHRSYYYAMGLTTQQIHQPFVGVASCWNEAAPCNIALMRQAQAVKKGVAAAGGTPREFCT